MQQVLREELHFFEKNKEEYLKHYKGQFVLIKGKKLIGSFTTEEEAYKTGVEQFGNTPFLINQVVKKEPINAIPALMLGLMRNAGT